jgi:hypothetical protein
MDIPHHPFVMHTKSLASAPDVPSSPRPSMRCHLTPFPNIRHLHPFKSSILSKRTLFQVLLVSWVLVPPFYVILIILPSFTGLCTCSEVRAWLDLLDFHLLFTYCFFFDCSFCIEYFPSFFLECMRTLSFYSIWLARLGIYTGCMFLENQISFPPRFTASLS